MPSSAGRGETGRLDVRMADLAAAELFHLLSRLSTQASYSRLLSCVEVSGSTENFQEPSATGLEFTTISSWLAQRLDLPMK
jgi:hypothetical protein